MKTIDFYSQNTPMKFNFYKGTKMDDISMAGIMGEDIIKNEKFSFKRANSNDKRNFLSALSKDIEKSFNETFGVKSTPKGVSNDIIQKIKWHDNLTSTDIVGSIVSNKDRDFNFWVNDTFYQDFNQESNLMKHQRRNMNDIYDSVSETIKNKAKDYADYFDMEM